MLSSGNVMGKIIGFFREMLMAALFGTGVYVGAYRVAQTGMLMPIDLFLTNSQETGFTPLYVRYIKEDEERAKVFLFTVMMLFFVLALIIFLFLYFASCWWVNILAPGMNISGKTLAAAMLRIMALAVPFFILGMFFTYSAMAHGKYLAASLRSTIQSIGLILGSILTIYFKNPLLLAWGFTGAYIFYFIWLLNDLRGIGILHFKKYLSLDLARDSLRLFWRCVKPALMVPILIQGNTAVERIVASLVQNETVAAVDYAKFITETGVVLIAIPLGMVGLSVLSGLDPDLVHQKVGQVANIVLVLTIPFSFFIMTNSVDIVKVLYARGAFDQKSVAITAQILCGFSIGLWAQILSFYFIRILNAQLRNVEVFLYVSISVFLDIGIKLLLYRNLGPIVLGLGMSVNSIVLFLLTCNALKLVRDLRTSALYMAFGTILYAILNSFISIYLINLSHVYRLIMIVGISCVFWVGYIFLIPHLRESLYPVWNKLYSFIKWIFKSN